MDSTQIIEISLLLGLVAMSSVYSASEAAIITILRSHRLRQSHGQEAPYAKKIRLLMEKPSATISAIVVGNNIASISASVIAAGLAIQRFGNIGIGLTTGVMTLVLLVFGEIVPKTYAIKNAERVTKKLAGPLILTTRVLSPVVRVLTPLTNMVLRALDRGIDPKAPRVTDEDIGELLTLSQEKVLMEKHEMGIIRRVLGFGDTKAGEIMTPKKDIISEDENRTIDKAMEKLIATGISRLPVYKNTKDNITGIAYAKDILANLKNKTPSVTLKEIAKPALFAQETEKVEALFKRMREKKMHMTIIRGKKGKVTGLLTMEDAFEELVGDIYDEHDLMGKAL